MNNYFTFPCDIFLVKEKRIVEVQSLNDIPNDVTFRILKLGSDKEKPAICFELGTTKDAEYVS
jgi:hypothetical protein